MTIKSYYKFQLLLSSFLLSSLFIFETYTFFQAVSFLVSFVIFLLYVIKNKGKVYLRFSRMHIFMLMFILYSACSILWSVDAKNTIGQVTVLIKLFILISLLYPCFDEISGSNTLLKTIMYSGYLVSIYTIFYSGLQYSLNLFLSARRLVVSVMNVNGLGIIAALSLLVTLHYFVEKERSLLLFGAIPSFMMVIMSGSKKAFIILFAGIVLYFIINSLLSGATITKLFKIVLVVFLIFIGFFLVMRLSVFSGIVDRFSRFFGDGDTDNSSILRKQMIDIAIQNFKDHPIIGTGIGSSNSILSSRINFNAYYHNNFVELLSCGGLLGFIIYYILSYGFIVVSLLKARHNKDKQWKLIVSMVFVLLMSDYGMVSYYSKHMYIFYMLLFIYCERNCSNYFGDNKEKQKKYNKLIFM